MSADPDGEDITIDGTIKLCQDLDVDPEDVVLLAVAYELKSPSMGQWERKGWVDGWKALGCVLSPAAAPCFFPLFTCVRACVPPPAPPARACALCLRVRRCRVDTIDAMQGALATLRQRLATDTDYFRRVYNYTFEFSRPPGQRSLGASLLSLPPLPHSSLLCPSAPLPYLYHLDPTCFPSSSPRSPRAQRWTWRRASGRSSSRTGSREALSRISCLRRLRGRTKTETS